MGFKVKRFESDANSFRKPDCNLANFAILVIAWMIWRNDAGSGSTYFVKW